jgi:protein-S-isoprenylcysteine O-methyltransferase Ste14
LALSFAAGLKLNAILVGNGFGHARLGRYALVMCLGALGVAAIGSAIAARLRTGDIPAGVIVGRVGPYRLSRNPLSLGLLAIYCAMAVATDAPVVLAPLPVAFLLIEMFVVIPNERRLRRELGLSYESYCRDVPQWI